MPKQQSEHTASFVLALVGGFLILLASLLSIAFLYSYSGNSSWGMMGECGSGMMNGYGMMRGWKSVGGCGMMNGFGMMSGYGGLLLLPVVGAVSGSMILYMAFMIKNGVKNVELFAALIIVFSVIGLFTNGGFFIGPILGILGGIFALMKK